MGYLLKERVVDVREFLDAVHRVARGGTALDREVVAQLVRGRERSDDGGAPARLSEREREVLALMAEGLSNSAIAARLVVSASAVEKHVSGIFTKLELGASTDHHRRVLAVLAWLSRPPA
jgi:DNA-binding NarL/FixJ family response regulator